jgi:hypothetical protein
MMIFLQIRKQVDVFLSVLRVWQSEIRRIQVYDGGCGLQVSSLPILKTGTLVGS